MTKEIIEGNKIIAEFDGWTKHIGDKVDDEKYTYPERKITFFHKADPSFKLHFKYHESWDWFMPVWKKFSALRTKYQRDFIFHYRSVASEIVSGNIQTAYIALVFAIVWYNSTKTNNSLTLPHREINNKDMNAKEFLKAKGVWERSVELPSGKEIKLAELLEEYAQQPRFHVTKERILKALYESANISMKEDCVDVTVTFAKQADAIMSVLSESSPAGAAEGASEGMAEALRDAERALRLAYSELNTQNILGIMRDTELVIRINNAIQKLVSLSPGVEDNQTKKQTH